jgi:hypothetical protein
MTLAIRKLTIIRLTAAIVSIAAEVDRVVGALAGTPWADRNPPDAQRCLFRDFQGVNHKCGSALLRFIERKCGRQSRPLSAAIDWRYDGPNLGVSGTETEIGAGISGTRTDPDFITAPTSN